jgi:hypothetical protein
MRALPNATMLCRVLLGLHRASASGTLHLRGEGRAATLALEDGRVVGANVDRRVATSARQLLASVSHVCGWDGLVLRLEQQLPTPTWWKLREPVAARTLALQAMRAAVRDACAASPPA